MEKMVREIAMHFHVVLSECNKKSHDASKSFERVVKFC